MGDLAISFLCIASKAANRQQTLHDRKPLTCTFATRVFYGLAGNREASFGDCQIAHFLQVRGHLPSASPRARLWCWIHMDTNLLNRKKTVPRALGAGSTWLRICKSVKDVVRLAAARCLLACLHVCSRRGCSCAPVGVECTVGENAGANTGTGSTWPQICKTVKRRATISWERNDGLEARDTPPRPPPRSSSP